ncbi:MAG: thioredoxin, partial [Acidobacteria bacterium]
MTRPWLVAGCLVALALPASAAGRGVRWADADLDAAMARARDTDRLVLVDCWAPWCRFCYEMDDNVWSLPELARVVEQETVPLRLEVDVRRGVGTAFARRYRVEGLPLVLLLDPRDGRVLRRLEGYQSAEAIVAAIDAARGEQATSRAAEASDDPAVLVREGSRRERAGDPDGAERLWRRALALDADCAAGAADDAALSLATIVARRDGPEAADALLADALGRCRRPDERDALWARRVELAGLRGPDELLAIVLARHEDRPDDD